MPVNCVEVMLGFKPFWVGNSKLRFNVLWPVLQVDENVHNSSIKVEKNICIINDMFRASSPVRLRSFKEKNSCSLLSFVVLPINKYIFRLPNN